MSSELNGIVVVDKPGGISSAGVVARIKKSFRAKKVGHTGTLDPLATGVLICCLNRATRLSRFFLKGDKEYEAELIFGISTDTQDATGTVIEQRQIKGISQEKIREAADRFVGPITQVPPIFSALKHQGTPLYKLARKGVIVKKPARPVHIYGLKILEVNLPSVRFFVSCSSGTYIRTLCADLGRELGCGAHLKKLRRVSGCGFTLDDAFNLEELTQLKNQDRLIETVIPMNEAMPFMPGVVADKTVVDKIKNGVKLLRSDIRMPSRQGEEGEFKVIDHSGCIVAVLVQSTTKDTYNYCCVF